MLGFQCLTGRLTEVAVAARRSPTKRRQNKGTHRTSNGVQSLICAVNSEILTASSYVQVVGQGEHLERLLDPVGRVTQAQARRYIRNELRFWTPEQSVDQLQEIVRAWFASPNSEELNDLLAAVFEVRTCMTVCLKCLTFGA